jgi:MFS family permease
MGHDRGMPFRDLPAPARRLLVGTCLNALGNGFVLPFLVIYLHEVRGISLTVTGAIVASEAAIGLVAVPLYGALIDRIGAKPVQLVTLFSSAIGSVGFAFATRPTSAVVAALFLGAGGASIWPAGQALIAELLPSDRRPFFFGLSFLLLNLGIGLGGLVGAFVVRPGHPGTYQSLFLGDAVTFVTFIAILATLRGVGGPMAHTATDGDGEPPARATYRALVRRPVFRRLLAAQLVLILAGYSQLDSTFPPFARRLGVSPRVVGFAFALNTATIVIGQIWVQKRFASWRRTRALALVASVWLVAWATLAVGAALPTGQAVTAMVLTFPVVFALGEMVLSPVAPAILNDLAAPWERGRYNAMGSWTWSAANVIGPAAGGALLGAHLDALWLGLIFLGCISAALLARRLEQVLPPAANGVDAAPSAPEPVAV